MHEEVLKRASSIKPVTAAAVCAVFYLAISVVGQLNEGYNADDWRHITGSYDMWVKAEGRWVVDFLFRMLFGGRFIIPLQLFLSFFGFLWISFTLADYAVEKEWRSLTAILIFVAGVNCPYLCDALSFNAHSLAFTLALVLSLAGFHLIFAYWREGDARRNAVLFAVAIQLIALSLGIYQPFALFGLMVPILCLLRSDRSPLGLLVRRTALCAVACVLAMALFLLEWHLYAAAIGAEIVNSRFGAPTLATTLEKLVQLPRLWKRLLTGGLLTEPKGLRIAEAGFAMATLAFAACAGVFAMADRETSGRARLIKSLRPPIAGAVALLVLPAIFTFATTDTYTPSRAVGYLGFAIAAVIAASAGLWLAHTRRPRFVLGCAGGVLVALGVTHALAASALWDDRARLSKREVELARQIYARAATLPGYDGQHLRIVGRADFPDVNWGDLLGLSVFHADNPNLGIFTEMFDRRLRAQAMAVSPQACRAFPNSEAAFVRDGIAYVCLNDFDAFLPLNNCARLDAPPYGDVCIKGRIVALVRPDCPSATAQTGPLRLIARNARGVEVAKEDDVLALTGATIDKRCYNVAVLKTADYARLSLSLHRPDRTKVWSRDFAPADFHGPAVSGNPKPRR